MWPSLKPPPRYPSSTKYDKICLDIGNLSFYGRCCYFSDFFYIIMHLKEKRWTSLQNQKWVCRRFEPRISLKFHLISANRGQNFEGVMSRHGQSILFLSRFHFLRHNRNVKSDVCWWTVGRRWSDCALKLNFPLEQIKLTAIDLFNLIYM